MAVYVSDDEARKTGDSILTIIASVIGTIVLAAIFVGSWIFENAEVGEFIRSLV